MYSGEYETGIAKTTGQERRDVRYGESLTPPYMRGRGRVYTKVLGTLLYRICSSILLPRSKPPIGVLVF